VAGGGRGGVGGVPGAARDGAAALAAAFARDALVLAGALPGVQRDAADPLTVVGRAAAADADTARLVLARASSRMGAHADALPALEAAYAARPRDESLLADLLHSEAALHGPAAAL